MNERRVVITGLGWVTSFGHQIDPVWQQLLEGKSGVKPIRNFDTEGWSTRIGGEITGWTGEPNLAKREAKRLDRFAQYAISASVEAVNDSGLDLPNENPWRVGSIIGTGIGGMKSLEMGHERFLTKGHDRVSPFMVPRLMCNAGSGNVSIHFGIKGPNNAVTSACASAAHAIGDSYMTIRYGAADVMLAGGAEAALTPLGLACFIALKALSRRNDDPERASRPFDVDRDGFILSEGAGVIVLEEYERAKKRGARIYAELRGYGQTADGTHITAPDESGLGAANAMGTALDSAGINPGDVSYINAHGTSTGLGDLAETRAIKRLFEHRAKDIPVSSTKSMTGHLLGASGGVEAIICAKTLETDTVLPTINLGQPSEECDLDYVPNTAREYKNNGGIKVTMSNSFGFGGHNVSLVMAKL